MEKERNVILINTLFNGRYLDDPNHVGGEVINLYQSDNGNFYVYVCPYGNVASTWKGRIGHVLFVRGAGQGLVKIIGKAKISEDVDTETFNNSTIAKSQINYIGWEQIKYGGIALNKLGSWSNNFVTFKAESIYKPEKDIYLKMEEQCKEEQPEVNDNDKKLKIYCIPDFKRGQKGKKSGKGKINNQSQKLYVDNGSDIQKEKDAYDILEKIINDENNWESSRVGKVSLDKATTKEEKFLSIIKKEDSELVNSNLIAYLIERDAPNYAFWKELAKKIFNQNGEKLNDLKPKVLREHKNIDILIELYNEEGLKKIIVIENKIRSNINGVIKNENKEITSTQLDKYWNINKDTDNGNNPYKDIPADFYILRPNYNNEYITKGTGEWTEIKYSAIRDVLSKIEEENGSPIYSLAMKEFKAVVEMHSSVYDNQLYEDVNRRFINSIEEKKKNALHKISKD